MRKIYVSMNVEGGFDFFLTSIYISHKQKREEGLDAFVQAFEKEKSIANSSKEARMKGMAVLLRQPVYIRKLMRRERTLWT